MPAAFAAIYLVNGFYAADRGTLPARGGRGARASSTRIRGNLDQAAVRIAAIDRLNPAARALLFDRSKLDCDPARLQMLGDRLRRRIRQEAKIVASCARVLGREPVVGASVDRAQVELLRTELHRCSLRPTRVGREIYARHAENPLIPRRRALDVRDVDDEVVERLDGKRHGEIFAN